MRRLPRAGLVIIAGLAGACRTVTPSQAATSPDAPGAGAQAAATTPSGHNPQLEPRWVVPSVDTMIMSRAGEIHPVASFDAPGRVVVGMTIEAVRRVPAGGGQAVLEVSFEQRDTLGVVARTTTQVDPRSLLPIRQRAELDAGQVVTLLYTGDHLLGIDAAPGRPPQYFSTALPDSVYSSGAIDLLLRALPLSIGFRTSLPLYFPSDNLTQQLPVRVEGEERVTTRAGRLATCWLVAADFPGAITEHFWIEERSHAILRILAHDGETSLVRYDR